MQGKWSMAVLMAVAATVCQVSQANLVVNGDFEADPFNSGWTTFAGTPTETTGLGGSASAAQLGSGAAIDQDFISSGTGLMGFQADFMVSMVDMNGSQRMRLRDGNYSSANVMMSLRLTTTGLDRYSAADGWKTAVAGTYTAGTTYYIRVQRDNYNTADGAGLEYILGISADGINYTSSDVIELYHTAGYDLVALESVRFEGGTGGMVVDNVSVIPEPATLGLVALFGGSILFIRRKMEI